MPNIREKIAKPTWIIQCRSFTKSKLNRTRGCVKGFWYPEYSRVFCFLGLRKLKFIGVGASGLEGVFAGNVYRLYLEIEDNLQFAVLMQSLV